jgi:hypothetical protein
MRNDVVILGEKASNASRTSALLCSDEVRATAQPSARFDTPSYSSAVSARRS